MILIFAALLADVAALRVLDRREARQDNRVELDLAEKPLPTVLLDPSSSSETFLTSHDLELSTGNTDDRLPTDTASKEKVPADTAPVKEKFRFTNSLVGRRILTVLNAVLALSALAILWYGYKKSSSHLPGSGSSTERVPLFGLQTSMQAWIFIAYVGFSCSHMFLQAKAGSTGYSVVSATAIIYLLKLVVALCMFCINGGSSMSDLFKPSNGRFGRVPVIMLPVIPAVLMAIGDTMSFVCLSRLDPVTYQVVLHLRIVTVAIAWQYVFSKRLSSTQWFSLLLFVAAGTEKSWDDISKRDDVETFHAVLFGLTMVSIGTFTNIATEVLLKEVHLSTDLLNACLYGEAFVSLLVGVNFVSSHTGAASASLPIFAELLSAAAWKKLAADPWMMASIICLTLFGITTAYFLRELSNVLKELSTCFVIVMTGIVQWFVLRTSTPTELGVQVVVIAVLALIVYNQNPLKSDPTEDSKKSVERAVAKTMDE
eukprot:gnl/TRDRNA2_/TRDRNA2_186264_c0_seq1.p1 gnl/TRDRNA2_/TRDRNA2_186264_c0~~gnl/TRDRNA2_/TRDRNA2_186264_c0_seq1.p1  ORF type:complete len:485 (+),score=78.79 gnl/TRDRNA2_/TRDRNA2_186264_c0_seq1:45-1499(+)